MQIDLYLYHGLTGGSRHQGAIRVRIDAYPSGVVRLTRFLSYGLPCWRRQRLGLSVPLLELQRISRFSSLGTTLVISGEQLITNGLINHLFDINAIESTGV